MKALILLVFLLPLNIYCQKISGKIVAEGTVPLRAVQVYNIDKSINIYSDQQGNFELDAEVGDEIRFIKNGFDRKSVTVTNQQLLVVEMVPVVQDIEEVKISSLKLTGDLKKDSKLLSRNDPAETVRQTIGLPAPPENPRETPPPTISEVGTLGYLASNLNLHNLYKNISGDARRMRQLYKFEDRQSAIESLKKMLPDDYFAKAGIKKDDAEVFLELAMAGDPSLQKFAKEKNAAGAMLQLERHIEAYLARQK